jgi:hypothetical protein
VFRGKQREFALLSIMIRKQTDFVITKIDGIAPFLTLDVQNSTFDSILENDPELRAFSTGSVVSQVLQT